MNQRTLILNFWEHEARTTRKVIARIPQDKSDYRPDPRSRNARELAWLMIEEERLLIEGLESGQLIWNETSTPAMVQEILDTYDHRHDDLMARMGQLDPAAWEREVAFVAGGHEVRRAEGYDFAWEFLFDQVHHRGQLSTYLRPMGATVPSIYGPSADEPV